MNAKRITVIGLVAIVALFFYLGMNAYPRAWNCGRTISTASFTAG